MVFLLVNFYTIENDNNIIKLWISSGKKSEKLLLVFLHKSRERNAINQFVLAFYISMAKYTISNRSTPIIRFVISTCVTFIVCLVKGFSLHKQTSSAVQMKEAK